jgi:GAF domain-containing protein
MTYPVGPGDDERVRYLRTLGLIDTAKDPNYDRIIHMCQDIFEMPIAALTLIDRDRQWFKSIAGLNVCETGRSIAFCNYTILGDVIYEVCDTHAHPELKYNELVVDEPFLRYYAGAPLVFNGRRIGALCVLDFVPHEPLPDDKRRTLTSLAQIVVREMKVQQAAKESLALLPF